MTDTASRGIETRTIDQVVVRFAGDSGDGMQLTGDRFTSVSAQFGNDLATLPEFPAEIRAPAGTLAGVSAFQVHLSDHDITTPGDAPNVLVAMNPAALKSDLHTLEPGGTLIVNEDTFEERSLAKAGYSANPLDDGSLAGYTLYRVPMTRITKEVCSALGVKPRDADRSKNFFALGLISWMYTRPVQPTLEWIDNRFKNNELVLAANRAAFNAGHAFGETAELFDHVYEIQPAKLEPGTYTNVSGNTALAWGLVAAGQCARLPLFLGSYPITPASDILHELSKHKNFGVRTLQAEDEIAAIGSALGASYGGHIGITTTSGPGVALKSEALGLAISLELPLLVIDIQRGGPSTGLPTKTEAADLLLAMYGRHGESPVPIVAAYSPSNCFDMAIEAVRIALKYRTPVVLLSDGYLANGTEPWKLPDVASLPDISVEFASEPNHVAEDGTESFWPYLRDENLARPWAVPGTPGLMHRIGGIEKEAGTGNISYDPANHEYMVRMRAARIAKIADDIAPALVEGDDDAELLVVGWGSTWGAITSATERARRGGRKVARVHLTHLNPFPKNLGDVLARYPKVIVPEMNLGQLSKLLRAEYLVDARSITKIMGQPFTAAELHAHILGPSMTDVPVTTRKDWSSDQEVRWCPGCGDYSILAAVQLMMPSLGVRREDTVFVSGIGCAARFPYYMNTYGVHGIHGRAPAIATGLAMARPDLDVWVVGGDGDMLSIGGNHLIHALRRNVNLKILMFNNMIYGLTKGQYSPTSEVGKITKSTPMGSLDQPFNPLSLAIGAEATFVARTHDMDRDHMVETFRRAHEHKGAAFVEVLQNCNVFNDGAWETITKKDVRAAMTIPLEHGRPIRFGADGERGVVVGSDGQARIVDVAEVGADAILVHDEKRDDPALAFMLSRLSTGPQEPMPMGVFRAVARPEYAESASRQLAVAQERSGPGDLAKLLRSGATWEVN